MGLITRSLSFADSVTKAWHEILRKMAAQNPRMTSSHFCPLVFASCNRPSQRAAGRTLEPGLKSWGLKLIPGIVSGDN